MNSFAASQLSALKRRIPEFIAWLESRGAEILAATNEWEVVRFKANGVVGIVYRKKTGSLSHQGIASEAAAAFLSGSAWRGNKPTKRRQQGSVIARSLRKRDGDLCFFCLRPMAEDNQSVEHLVAVTHGGPNHMSNFVLAHRGCNADAGHLSAMEKIRMHVAALTAREAKL